MTNAADADFYHLEQLLDDAGRDALQRTREFMTKEVGPVINRYWTREEFPHELIPGFAQLGIAGMPYTGYGCPGGGPLLDGMLAMELARTDPSIVHVQRGAQRPGDGLDLSVRVGGAEAALAAGDGPDGEDRRVRADRAGRRVRRGGRPDHHRPPRRRRMGARRAEEVDRQRHLRRLHHHLGARHR